jgi:hypothetical protein
VPAMTPGHVRGHARVTLLHPLHAMALAVALARGRVIPARAALLLRAFGCNDGACGREAGDGEGDCNIFPAEHGSLLFSLQVNSCPREMRQG